LLGMSAARHVANIVKKRRAAELKALQDAQREQVEAWFTEFDTQADGNLDRDEVKALLKEVTGKEPCLGALDLAMAEGARWGTPRGTPRGTPQGPSVEGLSRTAAHEVLAKVSAYVKDQEALEPLFQRVDSNHDGAIDVAELIPLLAIVAESSGFDPNKIGPDDASCIMHMCDVNLSGEVERSEILFACTTWKHMLERGAAPFQQEAAGSKVCVIL